MSLGGKFLAEGRNYLAWMHDHREETAQTPVTTIEAPRKPTGAPLAECLSDESFQSLVVFTRHLPAKRDHE